MRERQNGSAALLCKNPIFFGIKGKKKKWGVCHAAKRNKTNHDKGETEKRR